MNVRKAFFIVLCLAFISLYVTSNLMASFSGAPLLLFLVVPILNVLLLSATCPGCGKPVHGTFQLFGTLVSGECNDCR